MKLTKERRVYAAILGLAGAVWAVDRLWLSGGPQPASASAIAAGAPAVAAPASAAPGAGNSAAPKAALADRLESLRRSLPAAPAGDDAFRVPAEWRPNLPEAPSAAPAAPRFDTEAFSKAHRLTRVLMGSNINAAVVDGGSMLRPGQELDGMVLKEVTARSAIFERDGAEVELTLDGPTGAIVKVGGASENGGLGKGSR